jgi:hypothetical protein
VNATLPEFLNGELQPSRYDDVYRHIVTDAQVWTGDDQSIGWVTSMILINRLDIIRAVAATGNPAASQAGAVVEGWYLIRRNSDGIVWVYFYGDRAADANADFAEAELVYEKWETAR